MAKVRKDNKGRNLRPGETQRADGSYMYVYKLGTKKKYLYDSDLASLRVKEKQINKDKDDGIRTQEAMKLTLNDMFKVYMNNNIKLKPSTRANYLYLWDFYVKEEPFANMPLPQIHRSDILAFYTKLLKHGFAINSLESINTIVHPTLEMAVDDDYIRKNPSKGIYRKLKTDGSAPKPKRRIALTKTQQQNFLRFIAKSPTYSHWLPIMTVLLGTGMRVAECTGITKSDINLSENTISVNHNLIYRVIDGKAGFHITTPKTESGTRIIPILYPEVAEQLRLQIETIDALYPDDQLVLGGVHGFVFRNRTGSFMSAHNINRAIERISVTYNMEEMDQAELEDREPDLLPHFSVHNLRHPYVKQTTKIFSLRLMDFQAQAYPDARRKTRGACQLHRGGQSRSPVRPLCNRKRFSCLPPQSKMSWILYAISMRLSGYTSTRSISNSASSVVSVSASKIALDASLRLSCRACSSCFCFACANTAA